MAEALVPAKGCNIETLDGSPYLTETSRPQGATVQIAGWVIDPARQSMPANAVLRLENQDRRDAWSVPLRPDIARPDVALDHGGQAAYTPSGFKVAVDTSALPVGRYHLYIEYAAAGKSYACDNGCMLALTH